MTIADVIGRLRAMWSAIPVAPLCILVNRSEGAGQRLQGGQITVEHEDFRSSVRHPFVCREGGLEPRKFYTSEGRLEVKEGRFQT